MIDQDNAQSYIFLTVSPEVENPYSVMNPTIDNPDFGDIKFPQGESGELNITLFMPAVLDTFEIFVQYVSSLVITIDEDTSIVKVKY